ncbi:MAG TPA: type II secretion system protein GspL [Casimicrobiaceae bacterium]|nr:type II secretion system protein GspL [Casimicrobiaceae bacterium]
MTTLRVRLAAPPSPERADAWGLFDSAGVCSRSGRDRPDRWPDADRIEAIIAAPQVRIASVKLPPMPAARVAGAAGFAVEDQLAGATADQHISVSAQAPDGRVCVVIVARSLVAAIAASEPRITRIVAEPELAQPLPAAWRWCAGADGAAFIRCGDGSAFAVEAPHENGELPAEIALALARARESGVAPAQLHVDATISDAALARLQRDADVGLVRGSPWRWEAASASLFGAALDLRPSVPASASAHPKRRLGRAFAAALILGGAALAIHVVAGVGEWATLRFDAWRAAREWTELAVAAGVAADAASTPQAARAALAKRYAELRHAQGQAAPDDALPLLASAAPALAGLPPGIVKSAVYADSHWTLELARADPAAIRDLDARMRAARVPMLVATSASGARLRIGGL